MNAIVFTRHALTPEQAIERHEAYDQIRDQSA